MELLSRIFNKLIHPEVYLKMFKLFKTFLKAKLITKFLVLLSYWIWRSKAEELDINYDQKDKLRNIISDIILNRRKGD